MKIETFLDHRRILANSATPVHFALRLTAEESQPQQRPQPAAFCIVLDRSGSMAGQPLDAAKEATLLAVKHLRPEDHFSLVLFCDHAETAIPMQPARNKLLWQDAISNINERGSTNLTGGWMLGRDQLRQAPPEARRRLLLLTDGHLNVGIVDPSAVTTIVSSGLENDKIRTSCLGFGDGYNEDLLAQLSRVTGGEFYNAASPEKFNPIFENELQGLQKIAVQNVRLRIKPLDFCESYFAFGDYPHITLPDGRFEFALGDLVSSEERIVCFGVQVLPLPAINGSPAFDLQGEQLLAVELLYDDISGDQLHSRTFTQIIRIQATQDPGEIRPNGEVISWISIQKIGRLLKEVVQQLDQGNFPQAMQSIATAEQWLRANSIPPGDEAWTLLNDLKAKVERGEWSSSERKSSSYRSLSYLKMSSHAEWSDQSAAPNFKRPRRRPDAGNPPDKK